MCTCILNFFDKPEWVTIGTTFIGLAGSVYVAYKIFNSEQESREREENKLNEDHYNGLKNLVKMQLPHYKKQIQNIEKYLSSLNSHLNLEIVVKLYYDFSKNFELIRLIQYVQKNNQNVEYMYNLFGSLNATSNVLTKLEDEMLRFFERSYLLDEKIKSVQYDLLRTHLIELIRYCDEKSFNDKYGKIKEEYVKLVDETGKNPKIFPKDNRELVDKNLLEKDFVDRLIVIINPVFTEHFLFVTIGSKLNIFKNAINDKRNLENAHKVTMESYISILNHTVKSIKEIYKC